MDKLWLFEEAESVLARLHHSHGEFLRNDQLAQRRQSLANGATVIEPDLPIPLIIEAFGVIGKPFIALCRVNELDPLPCHGCTLAAQEIAAKYERIRLENAEGALPCAQRKVTQWVSRQQVREVDIVLFNRNVNSGVRGLAFAYQVLHDSLQTVVVPVVLFDAGLVGNGQSQDHNRHVLKAFETISSKTLSNSWLGSVHTTVVQALRRLITEAASLRKGARK